MKKIKNSHSALLLAVTSVIAITQAYAIEPVFEEVSRDSGIAAPSAGNAVSGNSMGSGVAWIDINNDTYPDLYITHEGQANRLYLNDKNGGFTDISSTANVQLASQSSLSVAVGDYNGDGFDDLFVGNMASNTLLKNNGDNTFTDVTPNSGLEDLPMKKTYSASFGDIDNDGDLDIYAGHWEGATAIGCRENDLYLNRGNGKFVNVSVESGSNIVGCTFAAPMTDYDQDGDLDIFLPIDSLGLTLNELLRNGGLNNNGVPIFTPVAAEVGVNEIITGMGIAIGDINNDGNIDFYRAQGGPGIISINTGTNIFNAVRDEDSRVGWGAVFFDANNDGYLDLYRGNEAAPFKPAGVQYSNVFYLNNGDGTFPSTADADLMTNRIKLNSVETGLGLAYADYDKDGDMDVVAQGGEGTINLFKNNTPPQNYLSIALKGSKFNHRGIGARVFSTSTDGVTTLTQMREIHAGSSHSSNNDTGVHFGLASHTVVDTLKVIWPDGCVQVERFVSANQFFPVDRANCDAHTISGLVINAGGLPVVGQLVEVMNFTGSKRFTMTNARGEYSQIVRDGAYIVGLNSTKYNFKAMDNSGSDLAKVNHVDVIKNYFATPKVYLISGTVLSSSGVAVAGVTVEVRNATELISSVVTDANGVYTQEVINGTYLVTPVSDSYSFSAIDSSIVVLVDGANKTWDYTAIVK